MSPHLPALRAKDLARVLTSLGFNPIRQRGSHQFWQHKDGRATVLPRHSGTNLGTGLLRKILRDIELSPDKLQRLLGKQK